MLIEANTRSGESIMIKDIVVNLGLGERDPAGDFAISVADAFEAHLLGVAFSYYPIIPGTVIRRIPPEFIESQRRESEKKAPDAIARFEQAAKRAGVSYEARSVNASIGGALGRLLEAGNRVARLFLRFTALGFDELRRDAAHDRAGDNRIVAEGHAQQVGLKCVGHRNGEVAGGIALA